MKNAVTYKLAFGCIVTLFCYSLSAQNTNTSHSHNADVHEANKRLDNYQELKNLGYNDREIFEDLGNANFLTKNYGTALFWYKKLREVSDEGSLSASYTKRYQYAWKKMNAKTSNISDDKDWLASVKADYQTEKESFDSQRTEPLASKYKSLDFLQEMDPSMGESPVAAVEPLNIDRNAYEAPMAVTADGKTAYFSKAVYVKPLYGIFSKKELVHKIYRADKIDGEWKNVKEVALGPKNYSAMHPAVSGDGKRLFFASNMPGTFGEYDIYVSTIHKDGSHGIAKNLGTKVNTKKNDMYPNIVAGNTLVFASEGRKGYGGLDVYMTQVGQKRVSYAVNLGSTINSREDEFSISLITEKGMGYVMTNRGSDKGTVQQVAFSYPRKSKNKPQENREYLILEAFNKDSKTDYTSSIFEDE